MCVIANRVPIKLHERNVDDHKIKVFFVRHGDPDYEIDGPRPENLQEPIQFEGKLKIVGENQIVLAANDLVNEISSNVYVVSSPRRRAVESLNIARQVWENCGIAVSDFPHLEKVQTLLTDATLTGELLKEYRKIVEQDNNITWMEFWLNESANFHNVENAEDFRKRMEKLLSFFQKFSLDAKPETNIVCFTHEEEIKVLSRLFGISVTVVPNGTWLKLVFDPKEKTVEIEVQGERETLTFKMHPHNVAYYKQLGGYKEGDEEICEEDWIKRALAEGIDIKNQKEENIEKIKRLIAIFEADPDNNSIADRIFVHGQLMMFESNISLEEIELKTPEEYNSLLKRCEIARNRWRIK